MHWRDAVAATQRAASRSRAGRTAALKLRNYCQAVLRFYIEIPWTLEESGELSLVRAMGGSIRRFIDVGANVGDWADAVLRASPSAEGILLEPSINASARLTSRFGNDRRIQMIAAAAGAAAGAVEFFEEPDAGVTSSVVPHQARGNAEPRRVPVLTLDAILAERGWDHVDVIKIDTEGYDDFVLAGAEGAIRDRRVDVIQFEYNAPWRDAGATLKRAMRRLSDGGYALYMLRPEGLFTLDDRYGEFFCLSNIVAIVPGREGGLASIVRGSM